MHDEHADRDPEGRASTNSMMATWATDSEVARVREQIPEHVVLDEDTRAKARQYATRSKSRNTLRAYDAAWKSFVGWCSSRRHRALPADPLVVAGYFADRAARIKPSTLSVHVAAINAAHCLRGLESPTKSAQVKAVMAGIRREHRVATMKKAALSVADIKAICTSLGEGARDVRDRALVLVGFAGAFRRAELCQLDLGDIEQHDEGVLVHLRSSKTDQVGEGVVVPISYATHPETCPVRALRGWLQILEDDQGPLFRSVDRHGRVRRGRLDGGSVAGSSSASRPASASTRTTSAPTACAPG